MWKNARWLKVPQKEIENKKIYQFDLTGRFAYFRCELELPEEAALTADITASSRYRLWVNEKSVLSGPCKGDAWRQYYETVDLTPYLRAGRNIFCVQVLYSDPDTAQSQIGERAGIYGVMGPKAGHRLAIQGEALDREGKAIASLTTGKACWRVWLDNSFYLKSTEITQFLGAVTEEIDFHQSPAGWKTAGYDASEWIEAEAVESVLPKDPLYRTGVQPRFTVIPREIPLLYEREEYFQDAPEAVTVQPGETRQLVLDAGVLVNGYPKFRFSGSGAEISIVYFEKFGGNGSNLKRDDRSGTISGLTDSVRLSQESVCYEPFWVRTFRFIAVTIRAGECPATMSAPCYSRTGYPLQVSSHLSSSSDWVEKLWTICERTLGNCMMETYMDCPYYEQLQFAMDTRLEALFTYAVTRDHALAKKALIDFHYGMMPNGLTPGKYPSAYLQILSTFSLHYIFMLWEYYEETQDREILRLCIHDVDRILDYFDQRIGEDGLAGRLDYWEFVDWHPKWNPTGGTPEALEYGPSTIINLMYAYALQCAGLLQTAAGRSCLAEEYTLRRTAILENVQRFCWDPEKGMYREGPNFSQFTRHAQAWAVCNRMVSKEQAKEILLRAIEDPLCLECSFSTAFEWFRALEWAGLYEQMRKELEAWIGLLDLHCTTCPETPKDARSDCHAWSALPLYEMVHTIAGIHWENGKVTVSPHLMDLPDLSGEVATPQGTIQFSYQRQSDGNWNYMVSLPEGMSCEFTDQNGNKTILTGDHILSDVHNTAKK